MGYEFWKDSVFNWSAAPANAHLFTRGQWNSTQRRWIKFDRSDTVSRSFFRRLTVRSLTKTGYPDHNSGDCLDSVPSSTRLIQCGALLNRKFVES